VLDFAFGGIFLWLANYDQLSITRAYYEHFFIFFGNEPTGFHSFFGSVYSIIDATMGILVIPSVIGILVNIESARLITEKRLESLLIELGEKKGLKAGIAKEIAQSTISKLQEEIKTLDS
jgi:uncharacterized membrane protein (DUF106 family)